MSGFPPGAFFPTIPGLEQAILLPQGQIQRYLQPAVDPSVANFYGIPETGPLPTSTWTPPTVWIEEQHRDNVIITEHPVEQGAPVTDHAFYRGAEVTIRLGWGGEDMATIQEIYQQIIQLKDQRTLFDLQTGKRLYSNMLIADISVTTDQRSEFVLLATIRCRELILVNTQTVSVTSQTQNQAIASSTAPAVNQGQVRLLPGTNFNVAGAETIPGVPSGIIAGGP